MGTRKKTAGAGAGELEAKVRESANRIWLAGLGAFTLAEQEGGKLFKSLVKKGEVIESTGRERFEEIAQGAKAAAEIAKERLASATGDVRERAGETWSKVEREVDHRVASALEKVGVPSKSEIARLTRRIEELTALVEKQAKARRAPAKKRAAKRA
jgi:poly(hydroxyalkanoate) granule-associated protein